MSTIIYVLVGIATVLTLYMFVPSMINILQLGPRHWRGKSQQDILGKAPDAASIADLEALSPSNLLQLFFASEAPAFEEMNGEYQTRILNVGAAAKGAIYYVHHLMGPGRWVGDAFFPFQKDRGWGYNRFLITRNGMDKIVRTLKMDTYIAPSDFDGKSSFHVNYRPYGRGLNRSMKDEIRKVHDALYLGIAFFAWSGGKINPGFFVVHGKASPWVGPD